MYSYKTIVVGTDGSDTSLVAVRHAASMARVYDAALVLVCAYHGTTHTLLNSPNRDISALPVVSESRAEEYLTDAKVIAEEEGVTNIKLEARAATAVNALMHAVDDNDADALVIGNKGMNTITGRVFGNIPTEIARRAKVDVVLVNTQETRA
ncbi:universal stress protein [Corynebacterium uterequi]|uniref:Universal stress protein UspA-like protein n=1 Tax=Corynebacterium uterequi TaxID=1072256 RepID=A0A0G3HIK8_9CORY|nr:universal stress protein [Corynebacterium uterequi]AKK10997.1 universal stress protein UspA-like protein [Corynebacterium uterequi]